MRQLSIVTLLFFVALNLPGNSPQAERLQEIPKRMGKFVEDGTISGAVTLVARQGKILSLDAVGEADIASRKPMKTDSLFWVASMTKPITATAIMMLQDESKLHIDDPVDKYLPEFRNQWLVESKTNDLVKLKKPSRSITIRDLLTHTSGLGDISSPRPHSTLAELVMAYSQIPLKFEPGSKWEYCNSGINTLGRIVEVVTERPFEDFLAGRLFKPLRMRDTTFHPTPGQVKRIAKAYKTANKNTGLEETSVAFLKGDLADRRRTPYPAAGLFSTAEDMWRFYQMILDGGVANGKTIISKSSIELMTRPQTGDLKTGFTDGMCFGLGWAVVRKPAGVTAMLSSGTYGHGGAYGTQGWVDPDKGMIFVLMIQRAGLPNADASPIRRAFQEAAVGAVAQ